MFTKLFDAIKGRKTYILATLGILVALVGHFLGPVNLPNGIQIPAYDWGQVMNIVWTSGLFSALRHGMDTPPSPAA